jgi:excisionase family DNA binding protein
MKNMTLPREPLVSISEASHILGVSEAALRQWTDEGKINAFITPGGHRRYSRLELRKFMSSRHKVLGIKDLVAGLEGTAHRHREIARMSLGHTTWYHQLGAESQSQLADLGRRLLKLIIRYVNESSKRADILGMIIGVGRDFGTVLAKLGLPLTDSVAVFIQSRSSVMDTATHLLNKGEAVTGRVVRVIPLVNQVMDKALVALVAAHQQYQNLQHDSSKGGIID